MDDDWGFGSQRPPRNLGELTAVFGDGSVARRAHSALIFCDDLVESAGKAGSWEQWESTMTAQRARCVVGAQALRNMFERVAEGKIRYERGTLTVE